MKPILTRLLALFALTLVAACGQDSKPVAKVEGGPALWQVQRGAFDGWLFGTIHVLPKGLAWETPAIRDAMGASDRLVLEAADLQDEQKTLALFEKMGRSPNLPPLEKRVPDDEKTALGKALADGGTNSQLLSGYESWAAAMLLSAASQQDLGVSQSDGVEPVLIAAYKKAGKPIGGLETVERQFAAFDTLPESAQSALLVQTIHEAKGMKALYDRILTAWGKGDMEAIAKEDQNGEQPDPVVEEAVLVARNRDWAKAIEPMQGKPFIAVGAGHLTGRENLIELLKAKGFTVTRVQ
ncbi:polysaccharide biosynthesis protein GumN [Sphingobium sp. Leaf26]|uniref:TraB/GumN family protein n=1 Tax=Sphingobium sp. Leaf26 TaxID=1735693 RepID=UPI0006F96624|nr:TraB/GumN family protein [Sphingobium sp. Leaf26]KQM97004.1 polysaccharide biosynthesis protein GumN [Sphingobium sp. Leaf26]